MADQPPKGTHTEDVARLQTQEYLRLLRRKSLKRVAVATALELLGRLIDEAFDRKELAGLNHALHFAEEFSNRRLAPSPPTWKRHDENLNDRVTSALVYSISE